MRRLFAATVSVCLLGAAVPAVASAVTYAGLTSQGLPISFATTGSVITDFSYRATFSCTDGYRFTSLRRFQAFVLHNRHFSGSSHWPDGSLRASLSMVVRPVGARGSLSSSRRFDLQNRPDPNGPVLCRTGSVSFSAAPAIGAKYQGDTSQHLPVSFTRTGFVVKRFTFTARYSCTDGVQFTQDVPVDALGLRNNHASETFGDANGTSTGTVSLLVGPFRATGSLSDTTRFDLQNRRDPNGQVFCRTGRVSFDIPRCFICPLDQTGASGRSALRIARRARG